MDINHQVKQAFDQANTNARNSSASWIRTVITVLTPSLVLLIGLQEPSTIPSSASIFFLVVALIAMAITILNGLYILGADSKGYRALRDNIGENWNNKKEFNTQGVELSNSYKYANYLFNFTALLSIISLTVFGVIKYVS
jgi:hypothetical protein